MILTGTDANSKVTVLEKSFTGIPNCVLMSREIRSVGHAGVRVMLYLYRHFNHNRGVAWPSHATLAAETGMSLRSVGRALEEVLASGLWERVSGRGGRRVSRYRPATPFRSARDDRSEERRSANLGSLNGQNPSPDRTRVANEQNKDKKKNNADAASPPEGAAASPRGDRNGQCERYSDVLDRVPQGHLGLVSRVFGPLAALCEDDPLADHLFDDDIDQLVRDLVGMALARENGIATDYVKKPAGEGIEESIR